MGSCASCSMGLACGVGQGGQCVFVTRHRRAGDRLYLEGERTSSAWFVKSGTVALLRDMEGSGERVRAIRGDGSLIGLEVLVAPVYADTAQALGPVIVCGLPRAGLEVWLGSAPSPARAMLEMLVRDLVADTPRAAAPDGNAARRVARWLLERDGSPLPRRVVANLLGMVPETLSRALAELRREGAILATRTTISIRDVDCLERIAGMGRKTADAIL